MDFLIGIGLILTLTIIGSIVFITSQNIKKKNIKSQFAGIKRESAHCPVCSNNLTAVIDEKVQKFVNQRNQSVRCGCGTSSTWNTSGDPFLLINYSKKDAPSSATNGSGSSAQTAQERANR